MSDGGEFKKLKICVCGGGGFIGSHLAYRLKKEGHHVVVADWKRNEFFKEEEICNEFFLVDLRALDNAKKAVEGCDWVFNLAADMGGMGFISANNAVITFNNTMISLNCLEAARCKGVKRYWYASSACVYPEFKQTTADNVDLQEDMAWPAQPQDMYGLEKLYAENACLAYDEDFPGLTCRVGRFHNIYGGHATWRGGREKAPAAFCRKVAAAKQEDEIEMWGDGLQTRSFCHVDDACEGILRQMKSDYDKPLNIGSDEITNMNDMMALIASFDDKKISINHIDGPMGVRGRNSDNDRIKEKLGWAPSISLKDGLKRTYDWIKGQIETERAGGKVTDYSKSEIVHSNLDVLENVGAIPEVGYAT